MKSVVQNKWSINFSANWTPNTYTIQYRANGGAGSMNPTTCTYDQPCTLQNNTFSRNWYSFNGWKLNWTLYNNQQSVNNLSSTSWAQLIFEAQWKPNTYYVTYNLDLWSPSIPRQPFIFNSQDPISSIIPTKTDNVFLRRDYQWQRSFQPWEKIPTGWWHFTLTAIRWSCNNYYKDKVYGNCTPSGWSWTQENTYSNICKTKFWTEGTCDYCSSPWTEITSRTISDREGCWNHWTRYGSYKKTCQNNYSYSNEQFWWWWSCACDSWYHPSWGSCAKDIYCVKLRVSPWWNISICWYEGESYDFYSDGQGAVLRSSAYTCTWNPTGTLRPALHDQVVVTCTQKSNPPDPTPTCTPKREEYNLHPGCPASLDNDDMETCKRQRCALICQTSC